MIYYLQRPSGGPIKIGFTCNLLGRLQTLQTTIKSALIVLGVRDGSCHEEHSTHRRFSHLLDSGEWFRDDPELLEHISKECHPYTGPLPKRPYRTMDEQRQNVKRPQRHLKVAFLGDITNPVGPLLTANLIRLGYGKPIVATTAVSKEISRKTGCILSPSRISNLVNSVNINPETIEMIAKGLGVKPEELLRKPPPSSKR